MENQNFQLQALEKRTRKLERWLRLSVCGWMLTLGLIILSSGVWKSEAQQTSAPTSLRVSELVVVDSKGVERVRIGGDLPDAIIGGKKIPRGQQASGVLLYDASGGERSGYVTFEPSGNVGLTLDSRTAQVASFIAAPDAPPASMLQLWSGKDLIELRSDDEGSRFTAVKGGQVVSQQPLIKKLSEGMCGVYREGLSRVSSEQVMSDCRRRFTETACKACLNKK
ncbi:MAG TPA: hypothetical protein VF721_15560 [Pyrinomonadaceae bacterium]|jgi:hypothetical protein